MIDHDEEIETLRERIRQLETALGCHFVSPPALGMTRAEGTVLGVLMARPLATRAMLVVALHRDMRREMIDPDGLDVHILRVRRKLAPHHIAVSTRWGEGWYLDDVAKARVRGLLSGHVVAAAGEPLPRRAVGWGAA